MSASRNSGGVTVLGATATPAAVGDTSRLQFRLENFSSADLTLVGVTSKMAGVGAIMITDGVGGRSVAAQLLIKEDETLDFETSHIWLELRDLREPLKGGDTMPFELIFRSGALPGRAPNDFVTRTIAVATAADCCLKT